MAFRLPSFNLTANVWRVGWPARNYAAPDLTIPCNLSPGRRVMSQRQLTVAFGQATTMMEVLCPPLADLRASWNGANQEDLVEVPAGSKRFYLVQQVDDIGKGFANEHRIAWVLYTGGPQTFADTGAIPAPVPLP